MFRKYEVGNTYRFIQIVNASWPLTGPVHDPMAKIKDDLPWLYALHSVTVLELRCVSHALIPRAIEGKKEVECSAFAFTDYKGARWMLAHPDPADVKPEEQSAVQVAPYEMAAFEIDPFVDYEAFCNHLDAIIANRDNWHCKSAVKGTRSFRAFLNMTVDPMSLPPGFGRAVTNLGDLPVRTTKDHDTVVS
jgi:hypothetical protein